MRLRIGMLLLLLAAGAWSADTVIMPHEIGVSCLKRKPFTAIARTTLTRVFARGTQRTVTTEDHIARDAEGRVLREQHLPWTEDPRQPVYYLNILDPKRMKNTHIDPQEHSAVERPVDARHTWDYVPYDGTQYRLAERPGVSINTKRLRSQQIAGLKCWGQRTTYVYSPGTYKGNQQPVTRTWEVWYAKEIGSDVRIIAHDGDPKAGDQETDLIDIKYGEPDPSIFVPPVGYAIQSSQP